MAIRSGMRASLLAGGAQTIGAIRPRKQHCGGSRPAKPDFTRATDLVLRDARGLKHNTFKIDLARRGMIRALTQAANGTPQSQSDKRIQ